MPVTTRVLAVLLLCACSKGAGLLPADCRPSVQGPTLTLPVELGTTATIPITFSNPLPLPLEVNQLALTDGEGFTFKDDRRSVLVPAGSCDRPGQLTLELEFTATKLVAQRATLTGVMGSDPFSLTVSATGNGPMFEAPSAFTFGPVVLAPVERGLPVRNIGTVDSSLVVKLTALRALNAETSVDELCVGAIVNGACLPTTRFTVTRQALLPLRLRPTTPGEKSWQLIITPETRGAMPVTVTISARVIDERGCALQPSRGRLTFGLTPMERQLMTVENVGSTPCILRGARIDDNPAFTVSGPTPLVLDTGRRVEFLVGANFDRTSSLRDATLVVDAMPRALHVPVAFDLGGPECLTLPTVLDFAPAIAGCVSPPRSITLANQCARPLVLKNVTATAPFVIANLPAIPPAGLPLQPGAMPTIIGLATQGGIDAGSTTGQLVVEVVGGRLTVPLNGSTTPRAERTDRYSFLSPPVDWVFVLDDSSSFVPHHARVQTGLAAFRSSLVGRNANARVAVTTTSVGGPGAGHFRQLDGGAWLDSSDPQFIAKFSRLTALTSDGTEQPSCLEAAVRAVTPPLTTDGGANAGFRRSGALALVCITDDVDVSPDSYRAALTQLGPATSYSVVGPFNPACPTIGHDDGGHRAAIDSVGGVAVDLCSPFANDFVRSDTFTRQRFFLSAQPELAGLSVELDSLPVLPDLPDGGVLWRYLPMNNAVEFPGPIDATELAIHYRTPCQ